MEAILKELILLREDSSDEHKILKLLSCYAVLCYAFILKIKSL